MSIITASARVWISSLAMWEISIDFSLSQGHLLFENDCLEEQEGAAAQHGQYEWRRSGLR